MDIESTLPTHNGRALKGKEILTHSTAQHCTKKPRDIMLDKRSHHKKTMTAGQHLHVVPRAPEF